jgi:hypothetical protein
MALQKNLEKSRVSEGEGFSEPQTVRDLIIETHGGIEKLAHIDRH